MSSLFLDAMGGLTQGLTQFGELQRADTDRKEKARQQAVAEAADAEKLNLEKRRVRTAEDIAGENILASQKQRELAGAREAREKEVFNLGANERELKRLKDENAVKGYDPEREAKIKDLEDTLKENTLSLGVAQSKFAVDSEPTRQKAETEKLVNSLGEADWLRAKGFDPEQIKDSLAEHEMNKRFRDVNFKLGVGDSPSRGGSSSGPKGEDLDISDEAIKLANALKPEAGEIQSPELMKLRTEIVQMVKQNIDNKYALSAQLRGKVTEATTVMEKLQARQAEINLDKADSKKAADKRLKAMGIVGLDTPEVKAQQDAVVKRALTTSVEGYLPPQAEPTPEELGPPTPTGRPLAPKYNRMAQGATIPVPLADRLDTIKKFVKENVNAQVPELRQKGRYEDWTDVKKRSDKSVSDNMEKIIERAGGLDASKDDIIKAIREVYGTGKVRDLTK